MGLPFIILLSIVAVGIVFVFLLLSKEKKDEDKGDLTIHLKEDITEAKKEAVSSKKVTKPKDPAKPSIFKRLFKKKEKNASVEDKIPLREEEKPKPSTKLSLLKRLFKKKPKKASLQEKIPLRQEEKPKPPKKKSIFSRLFKKKTEEKIIPREDLIPREVESTPSEELNQSSEELNSRAAIKRLFSDTKIKNIMTKDVHTIHFKDKFSAIPKKFKEFGIRHLPVVDDLNRLVGLITQRQMYKIKSPRKLMDGEWYYDEVMLNNIILEHVMEKEVYFLDEDQSIGKALLKMVYSKFGSIPVVDHNHKICGIVTRRDLLKLAAEIYQGVGIEEK